MGQGPLRAAVTSIAAHLIDHPAAAASAAGEVVRTIEIQASERASCANCGRAKLRERCHIPQSTSLARTASPLASAALARLYLFRQLSTPLGSI